MELLRQPVTFDNILQTFLEDTWKGFSLTEPIVTDITDNFFWQQCLVKINRNQ